MKDTDPLSPADHIEQFIFFLDDREHVLPLNSRAEVLLSSRAPGGAPLSDLFGVRDYDELRALVASRGKWIATSIDREGKAPLRWEFSGFKNGVLAVAADVSRVEEMRSEERESSQPLKNLVLNILPESIAEKLAAHRKVTPKAYNHATIMFTDVVSFSRLAQKMDPVALIDRLDFYFSLYDRVMEEFAIEKIKTIGDSYMSVSGIPERKPSHAVDCCLAALTILDLMEKTRKPENMFGDLDLNNWCIRIGIHTGGCIAGIVGFKKYTFDIWGDSVNIASRMEKEGVPGRINVSQWTAAEVRSFFAFEFRETQEIRNIGRVGMYFLTRILPELSDDEQGHFPNKRFNELYCDMYVDRAHAKNLSVLPVSFRNYLKTRGGGLQ
jgi:class 3 adenylate cyclase